MKNTFTDEKLDKKVLYFLDKPSVHFDNRLDRWETVYLVFGERVPEGMRNDDHPLDRAVRDSVSRLRMAGHLICDMGDGKGRWIAKTEEEFWKFYARFVKPISSTARTARAMKDSAKVKFPNLNQPSLFGAPAPVAEDFDDVLSVLRV